MSRLSFLFLLLFCAFTILPKEALSQTACQLPVNVSSSSDSSYIKRGINLSGWWEDKPNTSYLTSDFVFIRKSGFDFVRLPISSQRLLDKGELASHKLRCDILSIISSKLKVVIDLHDLGSAVRINGAYDSTLIEHRLLKFWDCISRITDDIPSDLIYINVLNEPPKQIEGWWALQSKVIPEIRRLFPNNYIIASNTINNYWDFQQIAPLRDDKVLYDFHYYHPLFFTHHFAQWLSPPPDSREKTDNIMYPSALNQNADQTYTKMNEYISNKIDKTSLKEALDQIIRWRNTHKVKLICLEFGVYKPAVDADSRARWIQDMREIFDEYEIPWAVWEYSMGFGIADRRGHIPTNLQSALGLTANDN